MIPKRIVLENFLSFGEETEIKFGDDEPLWVISGRNGVGKSAVFDAMTYALFGEHRGGARDHACLVRHGQNGFRVVFEFEFKGAVYQIVRNRPHHGRPTQSVKQWSDDGWNMSVQLPAARGNQDPIGLWSERTLGTNFDAFRSSVLLRQGESDAIITAPPSQRLSILKKIIGLEAYEELSNRVHKNSGQCKNDLDRLTKQRDAMTPVTEKEVLDAQSELTKRENEQRQKHEIRDVAIARVHRAGEWTKLVQELEALNALIRDADTRAPNAKAIRENFQRLNKLAIMVPLLQQFVSFRSKRTTAEKALKKRRDDACELANAIEAAMIRAEVDQDIKYLKIADEIEQLKNALCKFEPGLDTQLKAAHESVESKANVLNEARIEKARVSGLFDDATKRQRDFAKVGIGVKCSRCGQKVTEKHAKDEREHLVEEVARLKVTLNEWELKEKAAFQGNADAITERDRLDRLARDLENTASRLKDKEKTLRDLGITIKPEDIRIQIKAKSIEADRLDAEAGRIRRTDLADMKDRRAKLDLQVQKDAEAIALDKGREDEVHSKLPPEWQERANEIDLRDVGDLETEQRKLAAARVNELHQQLEQDEVLRTQWLQRHGEFSSQIDNIPADARVPVADAKQQLEDAKDAVKKADKARDDARSKSENLAREAERFQIIVLDIAEAERQARLHRKLDGFLGKEGIQRQLVRSAEREIVCMANETVNKLSDGDLTIELDDREGGDDQAFALRVRQAHGPTTEVKYLSTSQKFRVAVAIALAIGGFAAGQARPLESVIIDEGFGSLDRDGLRAAANELNRLRDHKRLRRIILVSHQEEWVEQHFRAIIRLRHGDNGTTAVADCNY